SAVMVRLWPLAVSRWASVSMGANKMSISGEGASGATVLWAGSALVIGDHPSGSWVRAGRELHLPFGLPLCNHEPMVSAKKRGRPKTGVGVPIQGPLPTQTAS